MLSGWWCTSPTCFASVRWWIKFRPSCGARGPIRRAASSKCTVSIKTTSSKLRALSLRRRANQRAQGLTLGPDEKIGDKEDTHYAAAGEGFAIAAERLELIDLDSAGSGSE